MIHQQLSEKTNLNSSISNDSEVKAAQIGNSFGKMVKRGSLVKGSMCPYSSRAGFAFLVRHPMIFAYGVSNVLLGNNYWAYEAHQTCQGWVLHRGAQEVGWA